MEIIRHHDEIKLLDEDLRKILIAEVERTTGRKVKEIILCSGGRNPLGAGALGAAIITLEHDD